MKTAFKSIMLALFVMLHLAACGQMGPLYLPKSQANSDAANTEERQS